MLNQTLRAFYVVVLLGIFPAGNVFAETTATNLIAADQSKNFAQPKRFAELLALPPEQVEWVDIARVDLLCAEGLPGAEKLDVEKCLKTLDAWAQKVRVETERNYHRFVEHPGQFNNSPGRYRMAVMAAVLSRDLRVKYNPEREKELLENRFFNDAQPYGEAERSFTSDASDLFLHGLLSEKRHGTCASMPYLYVAIGRRLGYPVSIAGAHMHSYVYYDEGDGKHFNVEATENRGFVTPSDEEYRNPQWGAPSESDYYEKRGLLRPLSNKESMARILAGRAAVFRSHGRHDEEARTWATAARYFPDTPTWKDIVENMQQCAKQDEYHQWRDGVWKKLAAQNIPRGPGFAHFTDMKIKLYLFMNDNFDRNAIEKAANEYKKQLAEYSQTAVRPLTGGIMPEQPVPESRQLYFYYRPPERNEVKVPADFMPPFPGGELPMELQSRIVNANPQDADTLLGMVWEGYAQMQVIKQAKQKAELERIASGNPILISEESIPPEFRQGVPMDLAIRLSGLHTARDIVIEMLAYKITLDNRQRAIGIPPDPMAEVRETLRRAGVPDSAMPRMSGMNPPNIPGMPKGMIPQPFGATQQSGNQQAMAMAEQYFRPQAAMNPGFALPYQVVPAAAAAGNPAVENPMPFAGSSPLTPQVRLPITVPAATKNNTP